MENELDRLFDLIYDLKELLYNIGLPYPEYGEILDGIEDLYDDLQNKIKRKQKMEDIKNDN